MFSGSQLVGIATTPPIASLTGTLFSQGLNSGGMILENVNMFASPGLIQDGLWIEGIVNPLIGHLHCQGMNTSSTTPGFCEHVGAGHVVFGGGFLTHDVLNTAAGLIDLGPGIDNNQTLVSLSATTPGQYIVNDEKNNVQLTVTAFNGEISQYLPGSLLTTASQGPTLYSHLNNAVANSANAGTCSMSGSTACTTINFSPPWNNAPACTATWAGGATLNGKIKAAATTSTLTISSTASETITVAYQCSGNPN
jgi:hypothetical protein